MNRKPAKRVFSCCGKSTTWLLATILLTGIAGCDGGLSGTGDQTIIGAGDDAAISDSTTTDVPVEVEENGTDDTLAGETGQGSEEDSDPPSGSGSTADADASTSTDMTDDPVEPGNEEESVAPTDELNSDTDNDALPDNIEGDLSTDPHDLETDGDGLTDGEEVNDTNTDPLNADSDDGGVNEGEELLNGTDPLDATDDLPPVDTGENDLPDEEDIQFGNEPDFGPIDGDESNPIAFDNTLPSGVDSISDRLPAFKLINLSSSSVTVTSQQTSSSKQQSFIVKPDMSSSYFRLSAGKNRVSVNVEDDTDAVLQVNPLNVTADSITTLILRPEAQKRLGLGALETQAKVNAGGMALLRIIFMPTAVTDSVSLIPDGDKPGNTELTVSGLLDQHESISEYSLAGAGTYSLSDTDGKIRAVPLEMKADHVYTILVTGKKQLPFYIEPDSISYDW